MKGGKVDKESPPRIDIADRRPREVGGRLRQIKRKQQVRGGFGELSSPPWKPTSGGSVGACRQTVRCPSRQDCFSFLGKIGSAQRPATVSTVRANPQLCQTCGAGNPQKISELAIAICKIEQNKQLSKVLFLVSVLSLANDKTKTPNFIKFLFAIAIFGKFFARKRLRGCPFAPTFSLFSVALSAFF